MGKIYYIGMYSGDEERLKRRNIRQNVAGTVKMDYVLQELRNMGKEIVLVAIAPCRDSSFCQEETVQISGREKHVYLTSAVFRVFGRNIIRGDLSMPALKNYIRKHVTAQDTVMVYHSLTYKKLFARLKAELHFRLVYQIEEIYRLSASVHYNPKKLAQEEAMFAAADGYLFVNDQLPARYAQGRPYAVSYGSYAVQRETLTPCRPGKKIVLTYTGIINEDRGAFVAVEMMRYLPAEYELRILGVGSEAEIERLQQRIREINAAAGMEKIRFMGTRTGEAYAEFIAQCHIGLSLMSLEEGFSENAFPSKIMTYLGYGLRVLTTANTCIKDSRVAPLLTFCDREPRAAAEAVRTIDLNEDLHIAQVLRTLQQDFRSDLKKVLMTD